MRDPLHILMPMPEKVDTFIPVTRTLEKLRKTVAEKKEMLRRLEECLDTPMPEDFWDDKKDPLEKGKALTKEYQ